MTKPITEEEVAMIHCLTGHTKPVKERADTLTQEEFHAKTIPELQYLSRRQGRKWSNFKDIPIGVSKAEFFKCDFRNELVTPAVQQEELEKNTRILCIGCWRTSNGKTPMCVGHMLRLAWHAKHPDRPRYYGGFEE